MKSKAGCKLYQSARSEAAKVMLQRRAPILVHLELSGAHGFSIRDHVLDDCMVKAAEYLLDFIPTCVFGYVWCGEISLLLADYLSSSQTPWLDANQQAIVSTAAALATFAFNKFMLEAERDIASNLVSVSGRQSGGSEAFTAQEMSAIQERNRLASQLELLRDCREKENIFTATAFNISRSKIVDYFIEQQQYTRTDSIRALALEYFPPSEVRDRRADELQDRLLFPKRVDWNSLPTRLRRGVAVLKKSKQNCVCTKAYADYEMPDLTQDATFIDPRLTEEASIEV